MLPNLISKFRPGDEIKVVKGTYAGSRGYVQAIDPQRHRVQVVLDLFGRDESVWLPEKDVKSASR